MASTYSTNLAIELIGTGDQAGTWGTTTNSNLGTLIEQSISGYVTQAVATGTDTTITIPNGATGVARNMYIELTGTGGTNTNLIVPANKKLYFIFNNSTGAVTVKVSGQTGVSVPTGKKMVLVSNGTDIVNGLNYIADFGTNSFTVTNLTASSGTITNLIATTGTITTLSATSGSITNLVSSDASATVLRAGSATLTHLSATSATITNLTLTSLVISNLSIASANITTLTSASGTITNLLATSLAVSSIATFSAGTAAAPSITTTGDTNTGLFFPAADTIAFTEGGAEAMRLDSSGNLGIGTSSPSARLTLIESVGNCLRLASNETLNTFKYSVIKNIPYNNNSLGVQMIGAKSDSSYTEVCVGGGVDGGYAATSVRFYTAANTTTADGTLRAEIDTSGNLGLGVTPSTWTTFTSALEVPGGALAGISANQVGVWQNCFYNSSSFKYKSTAAATLYQQAGGTHAWYTAASGTAGNAITFTQAMTLDASGNLGVGITSPENVSGYKVIQAQGSTQGGIFQSTTGSYTTKTRLYSTDSGGFVGTASNHVLAFLTNDTERARITAGGYSKFSNDGTYVGSTGTYHEFRQTINEVGIIVQCSNATLNQSVNGIQINYSGASPNGASAAFLYCNDSSALRASIRSNGGIANYQANDANLSDERTKKDIVPLGSMWGKFKAIEIVKFKYKDQTHDDDNIGVIAQQVESVAPEFIDVDGFGETPEDGVPLKTVYTTDMYHAAIKALQEAMARIETLEAKVTALESK